MPNHTPGPWELTGPKIANVGRVCGHEDCEKHPIRSYNNGYDIISGQYEERIWIADVRGYGGLVPTEQIEPNARLIAAAPELLEACRLALKYLEVELVYGPARDALTAAIANAEGAQ